MPDKKARASLPKARIEEFLEKEYAPEIVITVEGGLIQSVHSTNEHTQVLIADHDNMRNTTEPDEDEIAAFEAAETRAKQDDMYMVY